MKTTTYLFISILLLFINSSVSSKEITTQQTSIEITCTPELQALSSRWVSEFCNRHPEISIKLIKTSEYTNNQGTNKILNFQSGNSSGADKNKESWKMVVGRNLIVPVINAENPLLKEIQQKGISQEQFSLILNYPEKQNWGTIQPGSQNVPLHIYIVDDESIKTGIINFIEAGKVPVAGITYGTKDEIILAIQKDPNAIGFCNFTDIISLDNQNLINNILLLPIDKNGNGTIDYIEDIYSDVNHFQRGVWIGKFPKALYSNVFASCAEQPVNETEIAFLEYVLTDGQQLLSANGFSNLATGEGQMQLNKISPAVISIQQPQEAYSLPVVIMLIFGGLIIIGALVHFIVRSQENKKQLLTDAVCCNSGGFDENSVNIPKGLFYDKTHTWIYMEKDGSVSVGVDDFIQHIIGKITRIETKKPGEKIKKGELLLSVIQSGKQLNLYSPVSGTISKINDSLMNDSTALNTSPYSSGWVYMIEPANWAKEMQLLDIAEKYKCWLGSEFTRLKDFLAATLKPDSLAYNYVVLQDGGTFKDGVLADFGPKVWEDFQTNFLDTFR